jgi:electron transfer flavoprotein alpha subunit
LAGRVLAVVDGTAAGIHRRSLAAVALAQRLSSEAGVAADVVVAGASAHPPGHWQRAWQFEGGAPGTLAGELAKIVNGGDYLAVVAGDTPFGRELAARLAVRLDAPIVAPILSLRLQAGVLRATRPAQSGAATATLEVHRTPLVAIAHPDMLRASASDAPAAMTIERLDASAATNPFETLSEEQLGPFEMDVAEADVVVAGGRGVGEGGFAMLGELAALLGGSVGATRVAVDLGWAPYARQVGLTGKTVSPRLYVACGVSGAIHHAMGMRDSGFIVAINNDPQAPIFKVANVAIVGDVRDVVPSVIRELSRRKTGTPATALLAGALR